MYFQILQQGQMHNAKSLNEKSFEKVFITQMNEQLCRHSDFPNV